MSRRKTKTPKTIAHLTAGESSRVLASLLKDHPQLHQKAEKLAQGVLEDIAVEEIAEEVKGALELIDDIDNLNNRAGSHSWGYVEPSQAAVDICEEAVEPFMNDMKRRIEFGDVQGAATICEGLVLGLYEVKGEEGGVIEWAGEDTMCEDAGHAIRTLFESLSDPKKKLFLKDGFLSETFLKKVPNWSEWISKLLKEMKK